MLFLKRWNYNDNNIKDIFFFFCLFVRHNTILYIKLQKKKKKKKKKKKSFIFKDKNIYLNLIKESILKIKKFSIKTELNRTKENKTKDVILKYLKCS